MLCTAWSQSSVGPWLSEQWSLTYSCILSVKDHTTKSSGSALNSRYSCFAHKLFKPHCLCPQHQPQAFNAGHLLRAAPLQHRHHGWRWNGRLFWCWGKYSETLELEAALKRPKSDRAKKAKTHTLEPEVALLSLCKLPEEGTPWLVKLQFFWLGPALTDWTQWSWDVVAEVCGVWWELNGQENSHTLELSVVFMTCSGDLSRTFARKDTCSKLNFSLVESGFDRLQKSLQCEIAFIGSNHHMVKKMTSGTLLSGFGPATYP